MKRLPLHNPSFLYLKQSFAEHLDILGYAPTSIRNLVRNVRELLHFLEKEGLKTIGMLREEQFKKHFEALKKRPNLQRGGALANKTLNEHLFAWRIFTAYLRGAGRSDIHAPSIRNLGNDTPPAVVPSEEEIALLFAASYKPLPRLPVCARKAEALQSRDRAMLAVYYGCGLRRGEGVRLRTADIDLDRNLLHVQKSKNGKERFVPLGKNVRKYIVEYLYDHRPVLLVRPNDAFFLSLTGGRKPSGDSLLLRLKYLQRRSENVELMQKDIGLHTLRHGIATHLLKAGMHIESVARFLGHDSLESTQLYTRIAGLKGEQTYHNIPNRYEPLRLHEDEL